MKHAEKVVKSPQGKKSKPRLSASATAHAESKSERVRQALTNSELRYRRLFETAQDGILILDAETGTITDVNPFLINMLGYSLEEFMEKKLWEIGEFKNIVASKDAFEELQKKEYIRYENMPLKAKDGRLVQVEFVSNAYMVGDEKVIQCNIRDITERKRAEKALRESEERYRTLISHIPQKIFYKDRNSVYVSSNDLYAKDLGIHAADIIGKTDFDFFPSELAEKYRADDRSIMESGRTVEIEEDYIEHGELRTVFTVKTPVRNEQGEVVGVVGIFSDITERKRAEKNILNLNRMYAVLSEINQTIVKTPTRDHLFRETCRIAVDHGELNFAWIGILDQEKKTVVPFAHGGKGECHRINAIHSFVKKPDSKGPVASAIREKKCIALNNVSSDHYMQLWGENIRSCGSRSLAAAPLFFKKEVYGVFVVCAKEIDFFTQEEIKLLEEIGTDISFALDSLDEKEQRQKAVEQLKESEERFRTLVENMNDGLGTTDDSDIITYANRRYGEFFGVTPDELVGKKIYDLFDEPNQNIVKEEQDKRRQGYPSKYEFAITRKNGTKAYALASGSPLFDRNGQFAGSLGIVADITERKRAEEEIRSRTNELSTLYELSRSLAEINDLNKILELVNLWTVENISVTFSRIALLEGSELVMRAAYPIRVLNHTIPVSNRVPLSALPNCQRAIEDNEPVILSTGDQEFGGEERTALLVDFVKSLCLVPLRVGDSLQNSGRIIGLLMLGEVRSESREPFTQEKIRLVRSIGDQAAIAIHRAQLHEQTERRLQHLAALREIDNVIISSFDLHLNLTKVLTHVIEQIGVAAADVLLFNPSLQMLEYVAGLGFRTKNIERVRQRLGEGYAGRAALEGQMVHIPDLANDHDIFLRRTLLAGEEFVGYFGVPLVVKGQVKGVLEVFQREQFYPDEEWIDFLNALAGQAAIAIDNVTLFNSLQRSNSELTMAYDATIEGWSHALDLRDNETEGHTLRVADGTVKLAQSFNFSDNDIIQIRWGALLHDIGKMGVPDGILLKPGALTDEEWIVMKKHPTFALEMISPIRYLRLALDIPYCHHEKWDGTGYPRGLEGEQIPLSARIFAVVDVWDALNSDRPYRHAWPAEKVREHIKSLAGTHFDPQVVDICFKLNVLE